MSVLAPGLSRAFIAMSTAHESGLVGLKKTRSLSLTPGISTMSPGGSLAWRGSPKGMGVPPG